MGVGVVVVAINDYQPTMLMDEELFVSSGASGYLRLPQAVLGTSRPTPDSALGTFTVAPVMLGELPGARN